MIVVLEYEQLSGNLTKYIHVKHAWICNAKGTTMNLN